MGYWSLDVPERKVFWSSGTYLIHGIPQDTRVSVEQGFGFYHDEDAPKIQEAIERCIEFGGAFEGEYRIKNQQGYTLWVRVMGRGLQNEKGEVTRLRGSFWDIDKEKRAQLAFVRERARLAHLDRLAHLGELTAGIGHKINNPLSVAFGSFQRLKKKFDVAGLEPSFGKAFQRLENALVKIEEIVRSIRNYSNYGSKDLPEQLAVSEVLKEIHTLLRGPYLAEGVELVLKLEGDHELEVRRGSLQQLLHCLLSNAKDAALKTQDEYPVVSMDLNVDTDSLVIGIQDNGPGITKDKEEKVFNPFFTTKVSEGSAGLGLNVAEDLAAVVGADLSFGNLNSGGCRFELRFSLPQ